jgi:membrane protease YdiL (CAAX protease family)
LNLDATVTLPEPIAPAPPSTLRKIFIGKDGLRAGWSLLIFLALFAAIALCVNVVGHKLFPPAAKTATTASDKSASPHSIFVSESIGFVVTFIVTWIMSKIERRPNSIYGFGGSRKLPHFVAGLASGVICISLLVFTLWKAGLLIIDSRLLFGIDILRYAAIWLFNFLLVGLFEEYNTRGYLQYTLTRGLSGFYQWAFKTRYSVALGFWTAAVIFSILFGLGHGKNPGESPIGLFSSGLAAMVFCLSLWRTGSLWWAIGFHTAWNWGQSFLYGVAGSGTMVQHHLLATHPIGKPILSGGSTGPEGSILILAALGLASLIILITLPRAHYGDTRQRST